MPVCRERERESAQPSSSSAAAAAVAAAVREREKTDATYLKIRLKEAWPSTWSRWKLRETCFLLISSTPPRTYRAREREASEVSDAIRTREPILGGIMTANRIGQTNRGP